MSKKEIEKEKKFRLKVLTAPHIKASGSMPRMMWTTMISLIFPAAAAVYFFGSRILLMILVCVLSAVFGEVLCTLLRGRKVQVTDGSAFVTGTLLALILPPSFSFVHAAGASFLSICIAKHIFGGLGENIFNPALVGRAFLAAAFPIMITTYDVVPRSLSTVNEDTVTSATPLNRARFEGEKLDASENMPAFMLGEMKGSAGETSGVMILLGLALLLYTKTADWRLPLSYFSSFTVLSSLLWLVSPGKFLNPILALFTGGVLFGGTYMVTDPVTTPVNGRGKWIFGVSAGALTVIIRNFSGYAEGVLFSILLMNALTPMINRYTSPRIYGHEN